MTELEILLAVGGGFLAGLVNAMAGGGSLLTVPLLVMAGVPGNAANGSNRIGVLASSGSSALEFWRQGVPGARAAVKVFPPLFVGAMVGLIAIGRVDDATFERLFALVMVPMLLATLIGPGRAAQDGRKPWGPVKNSVVHFAIGVYGGAIQAGVGLLLVAALTRSGKDLIESNNIKVIVIAAYTAVAIPVFIARGQVQWGPALLMAAALAVGSAVGARVAVEGGERVIRPVMVVAVLALGARLLGLFG